MQPSTFGYRMLLALIGLIANVTLPLPALADETIVTIENFTFKPAVISVHTGKTITFKNVDDIPHSVVFTDGSFHSKALDTDDTAKVTFAKPGDFGYFCGLHPHMQGKVTVLP